MQLNKVPQITVFRVDDTTFEALGDISQYTSLIWPDAYNGYAQFELWAPITQDNATLLKRKNVLWCGGENAAVIEIIKATVDNKGNKIYDIKGRTLEKYLVDRMIWGTYNGSGHASTIMYDMVDKCAINPSNPNRKIPYLVNAEDAEVGNVISQYQKTGGALYDALYQTASESDIGFSIIFDPKGKRLVFEVRKGADRTQDNKEGNDPVVFSTELEDILSSEYYANIQDEKNVALVQGEDTGAARKSVVVGQSNAKGFARKELYVDARDLQSEIFNDDGTSTPLSPAEYAAVLSQRGNEKLADCEVVETFEAQIRQFGDVQYEFGVDYVKGDKVTVVDEQLGVIVSARITNVEEQYDEEYNLVLTFGYSYPSLLQRVKFSVL